MRWIIGIAAALAGLVFAAAMLGRPVQFRALPQAAPASEHREIAFVANAVGGSVSLIDPAEAQVIATLDIVPDGRDVGLFRDPVQGVLGQWIMEREGLNYAQDSDLSPDGRVLYVARGHLGDVAAFDLATGTLIWRRPVTGFRADHMTLSQDGQRLFVSTMPGRVIEMIDASDGGLIRRIRGGDFPHDNHLSPDGERLYNAALGDMLAELEDRDISSEPGGAYPVTIAHARTGEVERRLPFPAGVRPFAISPDEAFLYVQFSNRHGVGRYNIQRGELEAWQDLPVDPAATEADWDFEAPHHGLALGPDGRGLCLAGRASDYAALVAAPSLEVTAIVPVGDAPSWSAITRDGRICVVANNRSDDVSLVDMEAGVETARITAGRAPKHITIGDVPLDVIDALTGERR